MVLAIATTTLAIPVINVNAGDRNCDIEPDHEYCNGTEGAQGIRFCDLSGNEDDRFGDCYDRDFSRIDCDEHSGHLRCTGSDGIDGLIFCDVQEEHVGYTENCYERSEGTRGLAISECREDGYEDGKNGEWDTDREHECIRLAENGSQLRQENPYRDALEDGCRASGNPVANCDEINH